MIAMRASGPVDSVPLSFLPLLQPLVAVFWSVVVEVRALIECVVRRVEQSSVVLLVVVPRLGLPGQVVPCRLAWLQGRLASPGTLRGQHGALALVVQDDGAGHAPRVDHDGLSDGLCCSTMGLLLLHLLHLRDLLHLLRVPTMLGEVRQ